MTLARLMGIGRELTLEMTIIVNRRRAFWANSTREGFINYLKGLDLSKIIFLTLLNLGLDRLCLNLP